MSKVILDALFGDSNADEREEEERVKDSAFIKSDDEESSVSIYDSAESSPHSSHSSEVDSYLEHPPTPDHDSTYCESWNPVIKMQMMLE